MTRLARNMMVPLAVAVSLCFLGLEGSHCKSVKIDIDSFPKPVLKPGLHVPVPIPDPASRFVEDYCTRLSRAIYSHWKPPLNPSRKRYIVRFLIDRQGRFSKIRVNNPSEIEEENVACIKAVEAASGFCERVPDIVQEVDFTLELSKVYPQTQPKV